MNQNEKCNHKVNKLIWALRNMVGELASQASDASNDLFAIESIDGLDRGVGRDVFAHEPSGPRVLGIQTVDAPGPGGAYHEYDVRFLHPHEPHGSFLRIKFQNGPIGETDANGVTNEALLAIVAHRLECFQVGQFPCEENAQALTKVREALHWLHQRTADRKRRGVEGKTEA
jgi:hypothetical protein